MLETILGELEYGLGIVIVTRWGEGECLSTIKTMWETNTINKNVLGSYF